jgi:hypothetical protein
MGRIDTPRRSRATPSPGIIMFIASDRRRPAKAHQHRGCQDVPSLLPSTPCPEQHSLTGVGVFRHETRGSSTSSPSPSPGCHPHFANSFVV